MDFACALPPTSLTGGPDMTSHEHDEEEMAGMPMFDKVLIVIDRTTKAPVLIPVRNDWLASQVYDAIDQNVFQVYGIPNTITCDRDPLWSGWFREQCKFLGINLQSTTANRPQADGFAEATVKQFNQLLRSICGEDLSLWMQRLPLIRSSMMHSPSETGETPAELLYGYSPLLERDAPWALPKSLRVDPSFDGDLEDLRKRCLEQVSAQVRLRMEEAEKRTDRINKHRRNVVFTLGQWVWLSTKNISMKCSLYGPRKFHDRWCGPFRIVQVGAP
jgi:hypothetical protein